MSSEKLQSKTLEAGGDKVTLLQASSSSTNLAVDFRRPLGAEHVRDIHVYLHSFPLNFILQVFPILLLKEQKIISALC